MVATLAVWQTALHSARQSTQSNFERQADYAVSLFEHQVNEYANVLLFSAAFVAASEEVRPSEWRLFTERLGLVKNGSAISAIGVGYRVAKDDISEFIKEQRLDRPGFTIRPEFDYESQEDRQYILPLTVVSPRQLEEKVPGFDLYSEPRRRDAIERAISIGDVQITSPVIPEAELEPGFIMVAPIFKTASPETAILRQSEFTGAVVAPISTQNLASGILANDIRQVALKVSDNEEIMYNELISENEDIDAQPLFTDSRTIPFFGREWQFEIHSTQAFRIAEKNQKPAMLLAGGLIIDGLLFILFLQMSRENQRVTTFGEKISKKYDLQSKILKSRCDELEAFSFLVSHDLKAPLRAIGFLAQCFEEDFEEHHPEVNLHSDLTDQLKRIGKQVTLAQELVKGVLQYSGLEKELERSEIVNMLDLLNSLRVTLTVRDEQLQLVGEFPTFNTYRVQLTQVLMNLISNGYKYHQGQGRAVVTVSIETSPLVGYYRFTVTDNGPGIAQANHKIIFQPFATLQPKDHSMSSGVGLAIVNKLVVQHGGSIEIDSDIGKGASFSFDWPCSINDQVNDTENSNWKKAA